MTSLIETSALTRTRSGIAPGGIALTGVRDTDEATAWLLHELGTLSLSPFDRPVVLAHHPALRRALTLGIARATGCAASIRFVSPTGWVDEIAGLAGANGEWRPGSMAWRLSGIMPKCAPELPHSVRETVDGGNTIALLDLARAVAARFRAYVLHRPTLLLHWETEETLISGDAENERWQRVLWRGLVDAAPSRSPARIIADVRGGEWSCPAGVDAVVVAVADPAIPPAVREILCAIGAQRSVRWCALAPAGTAAAAVVSPKLRAATESLLALGLEDLPLVEVNASYLLVRVQQVLRGDPSVETGTELDHSLTLHACHSPLREIETLRERLVCAMENDSELRPHDVTLYVTSLERYLPAIDAVFGLDEPNLPRIPYEVAGRPFRDRSPVVFAVLRLLEASEGRATLEEISALLRLSPIADAAGFSELETDGARALAIQAGVIWGADGADRASRFQLPPLESGTWRHGIDRLVLGIAMGRTDIPVGDVLPVAGDSAGNTDLIGRLAGWTEQLFSIFSELRTPRPAMEWIEVLEPVLASFISARGADGPEAMRTLRSELRRVLGQIAEISPGTPVGMPAVRVLLEEGFEDMAGGMGHLRGGMRVCQLEPGTVLPSRIVLIAGVDDALHPGGGGTPSWDLLSAPAEAEDPDRRTDALDAFRQAIGSARSRVHVAWTGFTSIRHDVRATSVSVSELRDIAQRILSDQAYEVLVREEPAHPFSVSQFSATRRSGRIQSASDAWGTAAKLLRTRGAEHHEFAERALDTGEGGSRVISLEMLTSCVKDPSLFFCRKVLGLQMYDEDDLAEREPQAVKPPDEKGVHNDLRLTSWRLEAAQRRGDSRPCDQIAEWLRHQPELPYGEEGRVLAAAVAEAWWPRLEEFRAIEWLPPMAVDLQIGRWTIVGRLGRLTKTARVVECLYKIRPHSAIGDWVSHLVLNVLALRGHEVPRETTMLAAERWRLVEVPDAEAELMKLCQFYEEACLAPQPLFRKAGCAFIDALGNIADADADDLVRRKARSAARSEWDHQDASSGGVSYPHESEQGSAVLCWPNRGLEDDSAFTADFIRCTENILLPFMRAREMVNT